jgi:N-acetylgalactosamine kinase
MGRHVDHQGGHCNLMTIGYETLIAVHPRQDDQIHLYNLDHERFPERTFSLGDLVADLPWDDWLSLVNSEKVSHMVLSAGGDWSQYTKAAALRLQKKFSTLQLRGVDMIVSGNIPIAAGLSSSSALVVGTAETMVAVNQLDTFPSQFVDLCGEGEWFVGTRGGSADHAAIKLGQKGKVVKVTFFPFAVQDIVPFAEDYALLVCDSGIKAHKTANARDQFNHRVACYHIGLHLIRAFFPQYAPLLQHLRDINTRNLGVPLSWIYKILLRLPEHATREELAALLPDEEALFASIDHLPSETLYPIRGVVLYGLAECERSRIFADALLASRIPEIGRLMNVSHDGDRVARFTVPGRPQPYQAPTSNGYLLDLIEDLESGDPERVIRAQLQWQPGSYHCSVPEIDHMVDISLATEGIVGAQLAGAGLGGCMMVLAHHDAIPKLEQRLIEQYYRPYDKPPAILLCQPIAGSGVLLLNGLPSHTDQHG